MYEKFYGLRLDPFRLSPDHRFCFSHPTYAKARAYIQYALHRAEGFVMITGKPGTGKTTLVNDVLDGLSRSEVVVATLVSTQLEADDLLRMAAYAFGLDADTPNKAVLLQRVMDLLVREHREGRRALLIIDEAQDLSVSALEELRLLTNLQRDGEPLLQIVLLGQESLRALVRGRNMEQVHQRLVAACDLEPLGVIDTLAYVQHRLERAGWRGDPTIKREVLPILYEFSEGVPRRINLVCSRLLLHGCVEERHTLTAKDAELVVSELEHEDLAPVQPVHDVEPAATGQAPGNRAGEREAKTRAGQAVPGRIRRGPNKTLTLTDQLWAHVEEDIRWKGEVRQVESRGTDPASAQETAPGALADPGELPPPLEEDLFPRAVPGHAQRLVGSVIPGRGGPAGIAHRQEEAPREQESCPFPNPGEEPGQPGGLGRGLAEDLAHWKDERGGCERRPEQAATPAGYGEGAQAPVERETRPSAPRGVGFEPKGIGRHRRGLTGLVVLVAGFAALVAAVSVLRPDALERELSWLERQSTSLQQVAWAWLSRFTGTPVAPGAYDDHAYERNPQRVGEVVGAKVQRDGRGATDTGGEALSEAFAEGSTGMLGIADISPRNGVTGAAVRSSPVEDRPSEGHAGASTLKAPTGGTRSRFDRVPASESTAVAVD